MRSAMEKFWGVEIQNHLPTFQMEMELMRTPNTKSQKGKTKISKDVQRSMFEISGYKQCRKWLRDKGTIGGDDEDIVT